MTLLSIQMPEMMTKRDKVSRYPQSCGEQWVISCGLLYLRCHRAVTGLERLGNIWLTGKCDRGLITPVLQKGETPVWLNTVE